MLFLSSRHCVLLLRLRYMRLLLYSNMWAEFACDFLLLRSLSVIILFQWFLMNCMCASFYWLTLVQSILFFKLCISSFLAKTPNQRYDFFWICIFFSFSFEALLSKPNERYNQATSWYAVRMIRCVLNAFVDDENQSDSLITIGKVPDNRVKHILCLFTYLSHRIPIYRAACNTHTPYTMIMTRYTLCGTFCHTINEACQRCCCRCYCFCTPVVVVHLKIEYGKKITWTYTLNHLPAFFVLMRRHAFYMRYIREKSGWRLNSKDFAHTRCCLVIKLGKITGVEMKGERKTESEFVCCVWDVNFEIELEKNVEMKTENY